jgi:hypothetical protein
MKIYLSNRRNFTAVVFNACFFCGHAQRLRVWRDAAHGCVSPCSRRYVDLSTAFLETLSTFGFEALLLYVKAVVRVFRSLARA